MAYDGGSGAVEVMSNGVLKWESGEANKIIFTYIQKYVKVSSWIETINKQILPESLFLIGKQISIVVKKAVWNQTRLNKSLFG